MDFFRIKWYGNRNIRNLKMKKEEWLMYRNLMIELTRRGMSLKELSQIMEIDSAILRLKIDNRDELRFTEAVRIKGILGTETPLDELFLWDLI